MRFHLIIKISNYLNIILVSFYECVINCSTERNQDDHFGQQQTGHQIQHLMKVLAAKEAAHMTVPAMNLIHMNIVRKTHLGIHSLMNFIKKTILGTESLVKDMLIILNW